MNNEANPINLIVDTGATAPLLRQSVAKRLNLPIEENKEATKGLENSVYKQHILIDGKALVARVENMNIDSQRLSLEFVLIADDKWEQVCGKNSNADGILGNLALGPFVVGIRPQEKMLYLFLPQVGGNETVEKQRGFDRSQMVSVPITQKDYGDTFEIPVTVEGRGTVAMLLDTGADVTMIEQGNLKLPATPEAEKHYVSGFRGRRSLTAVPLDLTLGGVALKGMPVAVYAKDSGERPLLGMDVLSQFEVLIDYLGKKLYLKLLKKEAKKP